MADTSRERNNGATTKWIVGLCIAVVVAIAGWTVSFTQGVRARTYEAIVSDAVSLKAMMMAHDTRLAVLENKYDTIQASLAEIKVMLQDHIDK